MDGEFMLIKNINIITPYEVLKDYGVIINDGVITKVDLEERLIDSNELVIDGQGNYLSPGFIDIHNHGNSGSDVMDGDENSLDKMGAYHLSNGITSYLGTVITSSYEDMVNAMKNMCNYNNKDDKAQLIGVHLEGPFFDKSKKGAQPEKYIKAPDLEEIKAILDITKDKMKMVSLAPELEGALEVIEYLSKKGVTAAVAHTNATYDQAIGGINAGITVATHLYNGMRSFNHREPGVIGAVLNDDRVFCEIIYDRYHLHDGAVHIALKMKGYDKIILVSDAMRAAGLPDGEYTLGIQKVNVVDGAARIESGNLAGSTLNLRQGVYNMIKYLNIPIHQVVKMASLNPAKAINMDDKLGSIDVGKRADLLLFDQDINIKKVILGGNVVF